jgi:probable rRNA maturation factor
VNQKIQFFSEDFNFTPKSKGKLRRWMTSVIKSEKKTPWYINYIFCSDEYLLELNRCYLKHETLTDIITFPFLEENENISGDIFISIPRVKENAEKFGQNIETELHRVMVHGILHLLGYKDKSKTEKARMRAKENESLCLRSSFF